MPDPQHAFGFHHVTLPDTNEGHLTSPTIDISDEPYNEDHASDPGRHSALEAIETPHDTTSPYRTSTNLDDLFNISPDTTEAIDDSRAANTVATGTNLVSPIPATASSGTSLNLASFGSQPWPTTSAPYLEFEPRPVFEPTGELAHGKIDNLDSFDRFDDPTTFRRIDWRPREVSIATSLHDLKTPTSGISRPDSSSNFENISLRSALKRKLEPTSATTEKHSPVDGQQRQLDIEPRKARRVSFERMSSAVPTSPDEEISSSEDVSSSQAPRSQATQSSRASPDLRRVRKTPSNNQPITKGPSSQIPTTSQTTNRPARGSKSAAAHPPSILPPEKVFPIQIGSELFRLSGASISSDAPSYFTQFFEDQIKQLQESGGVRTLYIDRDPETFRDVARHLQGYYVKPRDGSHFVKLFADAQFYSLPRLIDLLFESEIFIQIGERNFQIPKDIFSDPGNSPNFFSLGFAVFFSTPGEVFPGLDRRGLLRPPSITPPYVPGRSAETFAELLHLLRGYPLHIRNESHRSELLRDCRYFHLRGLEQKIIAHEITHNLRREKTEICIRIEDIKPSGVSYRPDEEMIDEISTGGWVFYARPFVDDAAYELIVEIGGESMVLDLADMRADFRGLAKARVSSLFQVVANKMNLPTNAPLGLMVLAGGPSSQSASPGHTPLSEDRVKVRFESATDITLDGESYEVDWDSETGRLFTEGPGAPRSDSEPMTEDSTVPAASSTTRRGKSDDPHRSRKRRRRASSDTRQLGEWVVKSAQWRLRIQPNPHDSVRGGYEIVFLGVKIDAFSNERARNARRGFLGRGA